MCEEEFITDSYFIMLPCTETCVTANYLAYPVMANTHYMSTSTHEPHVPYPSTIHTAPMPSRRGRRSTIPPEIREQTRRLKKQNMERRRRACISDKMNALHNLALSLVGVDPQESPKVEKADILGICYSVFEGIAKIAKEDPEFKFRLHKLRHCLHEPSTSSSTQSNMLHLIDETTRSSTISEDSRTSSPLHSVSLTSPILHQHSVDYDNKENHNPKVVHLNKVSPYLDNSRLPQMTAGQWHSTPVISPTKLYGRQSADSGFHSIQHDSARSMTHVMPSNIQSSLSSCQSPLSNSSQLSQLNRLSQDHVFPKPSLTKYQVGTQARSAFTPIRQTRTSPLPVLTSPSSSLPATTLQSSSKPSVPSTSSSAHSSTTSQTMWRPYLD